MPPARKNWSRSELIIAFNLYCKTPFGRIHIHNPEIIKLAELLRRTTGAVSWKLANFARLDPSLQKRDIAGATHGGKGDVAVWNEFSGDWARLSFESELALAELMNKPVLPFSDAEEVDLPREGMEREAIVRVRVNQRFFREAVLAAYDYRCCITGLALTELLIASHIVPWAKDSANRVNPRNGLCLNAIHDRAFDRGLITVTAESRVRVSRKVIASDHDPAVHDLLLKYEGAEMRLPRKFLPERAFLAYHNEHVFQA